MAPEPPPPLPVADNREAILNTLSLLSASRISIGKSMALSRDIPRKRRAIPDDDDDLTRGARPNEGLGYVPEKKEVQKFANSKEERMLRGRISKNGTGKAKKKVEESESEEEAGRSALGKRKRPRREKEVQPEFESENQSLIAEATETKEKNGDEGEAGADVDVNMEDSVGREGEPRLGNGATDKKRKKKNKKKKKQKSGNAEAET